MSTIFDQPLSRRGLLRSGALGFGWLAFSALAGGAEVKRVAKLAARARRVIFLCMKGAPSHLDMIAYKPRLNADSGKPGRRPGTTLRGTDWKFAQHGQSGHWMSELVPGMASHADKLCVIHSLVTDLQAHAPAYLKLHTGVTQGARPSLGSWTHYGLGSLNGNLPGFVTITPPSCFGGPLNYGNAFLPAIHQGSPIGIDGQPIATTVIPNLTPALPPAAQRAELDLMQSFNRARLAREGAEPQVQGVIESFELAYKMQSEMPAVMDLTKDSAATLKLYGIGEKETDDCGRKCLLARRMVEAGVRFVEVTHGDWDTHFNHKQRMPALCQSVDKPIAGLLTDLDARGLLKDTLVIWSGEFGRTPHAEGSDGRDHHVSSFSMWMAGGGVKPGHIYGATDEHGYDVIEGKMDIHDWHATILHLLGLDHEKLTYRHGGREYRLTDLKGNVVPGILG
jgi:hypothetical protein